MKMGQCCSGYYLVLHLSQPLAAVFKEAPSKVWLTSAMTEGRPQQPLPSPRSPPGYGELSLYLTLGSLRGRVLAETLTCGRAHFYLRSA
jgi:hypothetical protein